MLGLLLVACVMTFGITACTADPTKLSCKDLTSNPASLDAMAKAAMSDPFFTPYIRPTNGFGGGGQVAAGAGVDESGLTNEFKNQVQALCQSASSGTQPYQTALGNTESFATTGTRTPTPTTQTTPSTPSTASSGSPGPTGGGGTTGGGTGNTGGGTTGGGTTGGGTGNTGGGTTGGGNTGSGTTGGGTTGGGNTGSGTTGGGTTGGGTTGGGTPP